MKRKKFDFNFRLVIISKIISVFGGNILGFAMILFLVDFTGSAALLGMISAASQVPTVFLTPFAGMIADRMNKKQLIVFFDVLTALSNFFFLWLLITQTYTILNITVLRMIKISISVFAATVFNAAVPRIVEEEQLVGANGALQSIAAIGMIGGSVVGGILFGIIDIQTIALASGILFLVSAGISMLIKIPYVKMKAIGSMVKTVKSDMSESFKFLKNEKPIVFKLALTTSIITFLLPPIFMVGLPFIVGVIFGQQVTLSFGIAAVGMLAGGIAAGNLTKYLAIKHYAKWIAAIGATGLLLAVTFPPFLRESFIAFWIFNLVLAVMLFIFALINSSFGAFMQKEVPEHLLGKVNSLIGMISLIVGPLGMLTVGFLIEMISLPVFFLGVAVITWIVAVICSQILKTYFLKKDLNNDKYHKNGVNER